MWLTQLDWQNLLPNLVGIWYAGQGLFRPKGTTLEALLLPTIVWLAVTFLLKEISPKPNFYSRLVVSVGLGALALRYLLWRLFNSLNLDDPLNGAVSILLFVAEVLNLGNTCCFFFLSIFATNRTPEADRLSQAVIRGEYLPWVDVILPTYNEGVEILRRSVVACQAMDYPHKRIYLLDDTRRPAVRALAAELGCEYRDRPDNRHAKAGNINHALPTLTGELIAVFDADFVPSRNFLTRTVGFFQDPKTAMVQTPQNFFNEDPVTVNLGLEGILNNEQTLFFRFIQCSRDFFDAVICCGTCFVVRRSALDEIGGIPTDSITEDYLTSMYLQGRGYRVKYLNEALSAGMSPETISAYVNQRLRWGQGTLQMLFLKDNFLTIPNLNPIQRFYHSLGVIYWLLCIPRVIFLLAPLAFLLFGLAPLRATFNEILYFYFPYYLGNIMAFAWLTEGRRSAFWSDVYETLLAFPLALTIVRTLWSPRGKPFKVTPKGIVDPHRITVNWPLIRPLLILMLLTILGFLWRSSPLQDTIVNPDSLLVNALWSVYNFTILILCMLVAIDVPQRRHSRFSRQEPCELILGHDSCFVQTADLSEAGARLSLTPPWPLPLKEDVGELCFVDPSPLAPLSLPIQVRWWRWVDRNTLQLGVQFSELPLPTYRRLVEYLYCQPGQWEEVRVPEVKTAWALIKSVLRLYPLAESR
ncbi:glycosyltransferase family 2 protein [Thermosynechococcus sp.]|uniref:glycosyltransferase family 2 protein n=1 Tax=Thermosynechococcus sp. TaxID=2814275 RepID=UPI002634A50A|nr:glycosyltransferase [Thermosynechococcus sp.]